MHGVAGYRILAQCDDFYEAFSEAFDSVISDVWFIFDLKNLPLRSGYKGSGRVDVYVQILK